MKDSSFFNLKTDKVNMSYKFIKIQEGSSVLGWVLMLTGTLFGAGIARIVMTLSLLIQLLHKFILFNADFGETLTYFLIASSKLLNEGEEDEEGVTLMPRVFNKRLIEEAELNKSTLSVFPVDIYLIFGFVLIQLFRQSFRKKFFYKWEEEHGRDIYEVHWRLTSGFYEKQNAANYLIQPLIEARLKEGEVNF